MIFRRNFELNQSLYLLCVSDTWTSTHIDVVGLEFGVHTLPLTRDTERQTQVLLFMSVEYFMRTF
jgi:hypothetical protein